MGYEALKNKKDQLIRKALDGSVFLAPIAADPIGDLTVAAAASPGTVKGSAVAVAITTGGNLVLKRDGGADITVALTTADAPAAVVTKINAAASGTASLVEGGKLQLVSATTGPTSTMRVVSGTGTVLADLKLTAGATDSGSASTIDLVPLPTDWDDLGWLTDDGAAFSRDVSSSEVSSWGSVTPTRTDVNSDSTSLTVVAQETKLLTLGLATGADLANIVADPTTGEVKIAKPVRPKSKHYRVLSVAVDESDSGEIYVARFLPRAKVTSYAEQSFAKGDDPITWGVTFAGEEDSDLGYSESWLFGGPGWFAMLDEMGF